MISSIPFSIGFEGHAFGDPELALLAPSLRYVARLASAMDDDLGLGALISIATTGTYPVQARVSWDLGGNCAFRGELLDVQSLASPPLMPLTSPGSTSQEAIDACLAHIAQVPGLEWGLLVRADRTVGASVGTTPTSDLDVLEQVAVRALGVLTGLEARHRETCVWLGHEKRTVVVAPLGPHCLVLSLTRTEVASVIETLLAVRGSLAPGDLTRVEPMAAPPAPSAEALDHESDEEDDDEWAPGRAPIGARFAGATAPRQGRRREGRRFGRTQVPGQRRARSGEATSHSDPAAW